MQPLRQTQLRRALDAVPALGMARATLLLYGVFTSLILAEAALITLTSEDGAMTMTVAGVLGAAACGGLLWRGSRITMGAMHVLLASSVVLVGTAALAAPTAALAVSITGMYGFTTFAAVYTCSSRVAAIHVIASIVACLMILTTRAGAGLPAAVTVAGILCAHGYVLGPLVARACSASSDPLTGTLNRRGFEEALQGALSRSRNHGYPYSLVLIDVDHFKEFNDHIGHGTGDEVLRTLAGLCVSELPSDVTVARVGGDEFALLIPATVDQGSLKLLQRLRGTAPGVEYDRELLPGVAWTCWGDRLSLGVAEWRVGESAADLTRRAEAALHQAKSTGRARTVVADASDLLTHDLAVALSSSGIDVVLQPIVAVTTGETVGVEALARWTHPSRGSIGPDVFIPVAEASGLIHEVGRQVLSKAACDVVDLQRAWARPLFLTINASGVELLRSTFATETMAAITDAGLRPHDLIVEVTESTLQASSAKALQTLHELRDAGVRIAIDDFGTGYSTMARLDEIPADFLKLDNTFTHGLQSSFRRRAMLAALQQMAMALGIELIVEGVEDQQDLDYIAQGGCTLAQGYFFQRPVPMQTLAGQSPSGVVTVEPAGTPGAARLARVRIASAQTGAPVSGVPSHD